ncbi:50S ribosomal protein L17, partial [bacterium]|nr:50S ribosomal protein L17 [bacterium]
MRHRKATVKLNRTASHRKAMFRNMVTSLLREERVETTVPKAKECRRLAERMITFAKRGDLHARRQVARVVRDSDVVKKLFDDIGPRFAERPGGYTRILKTGFRAGDNAPLSILELVERGAGASKDDKAAKDEKTKPKTKAKAKGKSTAKASAKKTAAKKTPKKK